LSSVIIILVLFAVLWLLLIRPQRRRQQQTEQMLASLRVGKEVVTAGGIYGNITAIEGENVWLEIAPDLTVRVARRAIAGVTDDEEEPEEPDEADEPDEEPEEQAPETEPSASERG
jgi:preprotein translocase subunit YajC